MLAEQKMLRLSAWNSRGMQAARPYLKKLLSESDLVLVSEHHLYPAQHYRLAEVDKDFNYFARSSERLDPAQCGVTPGHGGVAIFWGQSLARSVTPMKDIGTDRIIVVELAISENTIMYVIGVYLPQATCKVADYDYHSSVLESIIEQCMLKGDVIVMGDFNAHVGVSELYTRGWGNTSKNGTRILSMCEGQNLVMCDMTTKAQGPKYSFLNDQGHQSYIDHCLIPQYIMSNVHACAVLEHTLNTSDHLALMLHVQLPEPVRGHTQESGRRSIAWHKLTEQQCKEMYAEPLDQAIERLMEGASDIEMTRGMLETKMAQLITVIKERGFALPCSRFQKHLKPYWQPSLTALAKQKKEAWKRWVENGRPRAEHNELWRKVKETKKAFRKEQRLETAKYESQYLEKVEDAIEVDQKLFWHLLNKRTKQTKTRVRPVKDSNGKVVRETQDILKVWKDYYTQLYAPLQSERFDDETKHLVDTRIDGVDMTPTDEDTVILRDPITVEEVTKTCKALKLGKAAGPDSIQPEHLRHAGNNLYQYLTTLFNNMTKLEWRPEFMRKGIIVPIPKADKNPILPENNRGITLMSVLGKVYDRILLKRSEAWFSAIQNEQQGANRKHCSSLHTSLTLQEAVSHFAKRGETVYIALLDTQKAFDTVWQNGLFYKLMELQMDPKLWRIIKNTYDDFHCAVSVGGKVSAWFIPKQGIHQGDVLSMRMYGPYINGLLTELHRSGLGPLVCSIIISSPGFADDVAIITLTRRDLNKQLVVADRYSCKWRFLYSPSKTVFLSRGPDKDKDVQIMLDKTPLKKVECSNHVGVPICSNKMSEKEPVRQRISACRRTFYSVKAASAVGFDVVTLSKLYWTICVPKLLYGVEVWQPSKTSMASLETVHCEIGKCIQGMSRNTAGPACYILLGWLPLYAQIDIRRLIFILALLRLPFDTVCNKLAIRMWSRSRCTDASSLCSPLGRIYEIARKYGLLDAVHQMLDTGLLPSKLSWRQTVKQAVHSHYTRQWMAECMLYSSLELLAQVVDKVHLSIWWTVGRRNPNSRKQCKTIVKLLTGNHALGEGRQRHVNNTSLCQLCDLYVTEDVCHMLFKCPGLSQHRERETPALLNALPGVMKNEILGMSDCDKTIFLMSGLRSDYIPEWNTAFVAAADYVSILYRARESVLLN